MVVGTLALLSVITVIYVSIGRSDRQTSAAALKFDKRQDAPAVVRDYLAGVIADDVFAPADTTDFTSFLQPFADTDADAFLVTWAGGGFVPLLQAAIDLGVIDKIASVGTKPGDRPLEDVRMKIKVVK